MSAPGPSLLPISVVIPSRNRSGLLEQTLRALLAQTALPSEVLVVDASDEECFESNGTLVRQLATAAPVPISQVKAARAGAAPQRNQGVAAARQPHLLFLDDDILMEPACLALMLEALHSSPEVGGVSATISNAAFRTPGAFSRSLFRWLDDGPRDDRGYAGRCLGPGLTTMPSAEDSLPGVNRVDWLITGCTLYRKAALPDPPFPSFFHDASIGEDLALSLTIGRTWKLANARTARVEHLGAHRDHSARRECMLAEMELVNRHFIMTRVLHRKTFRDYVQFLTIQFGLLPTTLIQKRGWRHFPARLWGRLRGLGRILEGERPG